MLTPENILVEFQNGNRAAFEYIFNNCWDPVYLTAFKRVGDEDIAKEITQELFIYLWEKREHISINGPLLSYLIGGVKFRVINYFRSTITRERYHNDLLLLMNEQPVNSAESTFKVKDIENALEETMIMMPERMRLIFSMNRLEQKTISEIAEELNMKGQTVKNQLTAALKIVRRHFPLSLLILLLIIS